MFDPTRRVLLQALCLSLCAHLLGLLSLHPLYAGRPRQAADATRPEALRGVLRAPAVPSRTALPAVKPGAVASPAHRPRSGPTVRGRREAGASPGRRLEGAALPMSALPPTPAGPAPPPAEGLYDYRLSLAAAARAFRDYPPEARARGESGQAVVGIEVVVGRSRIELAESSGHPALDAAALAMIRQAAALTPLPAALQGLDFQLRLPVLFSLDAAPPVQ